MRTRGILHSEYLLKYCLCTESIELITGLYCRLACKDGEDGALQLLLIPCVEAYECCYLLLYVPCNCRQGCDQPSAILFFEDYPKA